MGSAAQTKAIKKVAGSIKLELAQYREMAAFSQFASDLDQSTQNLLARGERLTELLKQPQYSPFSMADQVVTIFAGVPGYLRKLEVNQVKRYESEMLRTLYHEQPEITEDIRKTNQLSDENKAKLVAFLDKFATLFA